MKTFSLGQLLYIRGTPVRVVHIKERLRHEKGVRHTGVRTAMITLRDVRGMKEVFGFRRLQEILLYG